MHWCEPMKLWLVTRHDDVLAGLHEPRFSSDRTGMYEQALPPALRQRVQPLLDHVLKWIQLSDDPDHTRLRKLVNVAFTPKMIQLLLPRVNELVAGLLDGTPRGEPFDIIDRFCRPLPATVICEMLGIPRDEQEEFRLLTERVMLFSTSGDAKLHEHADQAHAALDRLIAMFERLIAERRKTPRLDLLSALVQAEANVERLSNDELYAMCVFIFLAGHESTTNGIASGLLILLQHPDQFAALKANTDGLVRGAIEETLRYKSPVIRAVRLVREDFDFGGQRLRAGQLAVMLLGAAHRDPAQFPDPDRFDIARPTQRNLAFGHGLHFCLGAMLARIEMETAVRAVVQRMPNLRLADQPLRWKPTMGIRALERLAVVNP